jgi:UTP-glucose-1-phosphate uridylyltransferase
VLSRTDRYDTGTPIGWLTAVVDLALNDPVIGEDFGAYLRTRVN